MTTNRLTLVQHLRRSALLRDGGEQTDGQLLEAFLQGRDGLALEALVRRHAPMVWGVCRRILTHHDAEDAFQATFLVLVRKAASIRSPELLPNWLYRVACLTERKARQRAAKRCSREKQVSVLPEPPMQPHDDAFGPDLRALLDEELSRLPEKCRIAVVLCDVQGRTLHDAAQQLGLPEGTVASRLTRGAGAAGQATSARGLSVSATALAAAELQQAASGAVPAALPTHTSTAVSLLAAGNAVTAGLLSPGAGPLAEGVLHAMAVAKLKTAGVLLILAALVLASGLVTCHALEARRAQLQPESPGEVRRFPASEAPGEVRCFTVKEWVWSVSFSPDGRRALIGTGGRGVPLRICDVSSGKMAPRRGKRGHS